MEKHNADYTEGLNLTHLAVEEFYGRQEFNCAESLLLAGSEIYGLGYVPGAGSPAAGFGGGMGIGHVCGALTGALMVLSMLFVQERAHESETMKLVASTFLERFRNQYGSLMCDELKTAYYDASKGCAAVVALAGEVLEEIVAEFDALRVR